MGSQVILPFPEFIQIKWDLKKIVSPSQLRLLRPGNLCLRKRWKRRPKRNQSKRLLFDQFKRHRECKRRWSKALMERVLKRFEPLFSSSGREHSGQRVIPSFLANLPLQGTDWMPTTPTNIKLNLLLRNCMTLMYQRSTR